MTVLGIGTDLIRKTRFETILTKHNYPNVTSSHVVRLAKRILHPEREYPLFLKSSKDCDKSQCVQLLAGSWCVKEALFKSLSYSDQQLFSFKDWFKLNDPKGRPFIMNQDYFTKHPNEEFLVSITHDGDYIASTVIRQQLNNA
ncbi:Phosphopantetheine:protein transferase [Komagataella phaffii CBS 7435]|uniref:4'-phosphopantetheinyl transferase domain-containing protein n=2 Tax=Komagataella phaffii TaxID=460519 RepID=C4QVI0_KOMPG|nr:Hypothetical protein PAS_chr1-3_0190 [Komagataella phaffii GS115]AOA61806.1 GQ67_02445T0 [Komagataella phaffii]CAH2445909.1 Phosphopantetheineprotein transferase [Komagataella phaffii CBS 7435]AOA66730.1 GQ68_02802T0 [Komagataella phaffii GS115]CAY67253.1 Hypothetical protein PAS_chr1-3_0190 [Komagataella phaffii GS115]SCV11773.1 Phosphopantetheine:protein transferase [Komagataella phaffii CBS 7435]